MISIMSSVVPIIFAFSNVPPAHDAKFKFEVWLGYARALAVDGALPNWFPILNHGVNTVIYGLTLDGTDYLTIIAMHLFQLKPSVAFSFYLFLNVLLMNHALAFIFARLNLAKIWAFTFITLNSLSYWNYWQYNWNLFLLTKLLIVFCFTLNFTYKRNVSSLLLLFIINIGYVPFGGATYLSLIIVYIEALLFFAYLVIAAIRNQIKISNLKLKSHGKDFIYIALIAFYLYYFLLQFIQLKKDIRFTAPSRDSLGNMSLENFLSYGGYLGIEKYTQLFGNILKSQIVGPGSPDFQLQIGSLSLIYVIFGVFYNREKLSILSKLAITIVLLCFIIFYPFQLFWTLAYKFAPGIDLVRHLSYLSVIVTLPLIYLIAKLFSGQKKQRYSRFTFYLISTSCVYIVIVFIVVWKPIVNASTTRFETPVLAVVLILICLYAYYIYHIKRHSEKIFLNNWGIAFVFMGAAMAQSLVSFSAQVPIYQMIKTSYLNQVDIPYNEQLPKTRTYQPENFLNQSWTNSGGVTYGTKALLTNADYCRAAWRQDSMSTSLYEWNNQEYKGLTCYKDKVGVFQDQIELEKASRISFLSFNKVQIVYSLPKSLRSDLDRKKAILIYRDAMSRAGIWQARDEKGDIVPIVESIEGFKSVAITKNQGEITFTVKRLNVLTNTIKMFLDLLVLIIIWIQIFVKRV